LIYEEDYIDILEIQFTIIRKLFFVNVENEIVKIIFLISCFDEIGALGEVSKACKIM